MPKELNLSLLIRYGYAGGLLYLILLFFNKDLVKSYSESIGSILVLFIIFSGGTCIYAIYRHLIGEWFLFPLAHFWDWIFSKSNKRQTGAVSTVWWLAQQGVPQGARREAYTALRREVPCEINLKKAVQTKKQLDLSHSEVYVLYISFIEVFILSCVLLRYKGSHLANWVLLGSALIFLCAAWAADVRLHRQEFRSLVPIDAEKRQQVLKFLRDRGYIQGPSLDNQELGTDRTRSSASSS